MAKEDKAPKGEKPAKDEAKKYGITDLSTALGIEPASVRVKLRKAKIEKVGGRYGWDTKAEMNAVIDKIKAMEKAGKTEGKKSSKKAGKDEDDDDDDDGE